MKKLLVTGMMFLSMGSVNASGFDIEWYEFASMTTYSSLDVTFSGLLGAFSKEQIEALAEDVQNYDLSGEVRPELASLLEGLKNSNSELSEEEAIDELRTILID